MEMITFNNVNYFFKCINCSKISHSGDITFITGKIRVRVEVKNHNKYEKYQYDKFCYDLYYNSKINGWKYEIGLFVYLYDKNDDNFYDINRNIVIIKGISKNSIEGSPIIKLEELTSPFLAIPMSKTNRFGLIVNKIKPIFKKLLNKEGYKMITEGANNYKTIMDDKSTNTDPIIEDIEMLKDENARLKAENARLKELLNTS